MESDDSCQLVLFLSSDHDGTVAASTPLLLRTPRFTSRQVASVVRSVSPRIEQLPARLWRAPRRPEFGRAVLVDIPENHPFVMGERIDSWVIVE